MLLRTAPNFTLSVQRGEKSQNRPLTNHNTDACATRVLAVKWLIIVTRVIMVAAAACLLFLSYHRTVTTEREEIVCFFD